MNIIIWWYSFNLFVKTIIHTNSKQIRITLNQIKKTIEFFSDPGKDVL